MSTKTLDPYYLDRLYEKLWNLLEPGIRAVYSRMKMSKEGYLKYHNLILEYCEKGDLLINHFCDEPQEPGFSFRPQIPELREQAKHLFLPHMSKSPQVSSWKQDCNEPQEPGVSLCPQGPRRFYQQIKRFLRSHVSNLPQDAQDMPDEQLLQFYSSHWHDYQFSSRMFNGICAYLNRHLTFYEDESEYLDAYSLALVSWKECWTTHLEKLTCAILRMIEKERNGEQVDTCILSQTLDSYVEMGQKTNDPSVKTPTLDVYKENFETAFLQHTEHYYLRKSSEFLSKNSVTEYTKHVEMRLKEEKKRAQTYLHESTADSLIKACEKVLIETHLTAFLSEFHNHLEACKIEDLRCVNTLLESFKRGHAELKTMLESFICNQGQTAIERCGTGAISDPRVYVQTILDVHKKYCTLVCTAFDNDADFVAALDKACVSFINKNAVTQMKTDGSSKSSELLCGYFDLLLKKSSKGLEEAELEEHMDQAMIVFKYIEDKDVFEKLYSRKLAQRLLHCTSASDDAEARMISRLREVCGFRYAYKLQRMVQGIQVSKDLNENFKKHLEKSDEEPLGIDFQVQVLTSGHWPLQQSFSISLPAELARGVERFGTFYNAQHSGRKLHWLHKYSRGELVTNCFKNRHIIQVSTFQMAVLLMFNDSATLTVQQITDGTQLNTDMLIPVLQAILRSQLLECHDEDTDLKPESELSVFFNFKNKRMRINLNVPIKAEEDKERQSIHKVVEEERKHVVQAAIVRIMKMCKELNHQLLISEVISQLSSRFKVHVPAIKNHIENLITREYLERVPGQKDVYRYLA